MKFNIFESYFLKKKKKKEKKEKEKKVRPHRSEQRVLDMNVVDRFLSLGS